MSGDAFHCDQCGCTALMREGCAYCNPRPRAERRGAEPVPAVDDEPALADDRQLALGL
jgi:hypothetical protein